MTITADTIVASEVFGRKPRTPEYPLIDPAFPRGAERDRDGRQLIAVTLHRPFEVDPGDWGRLWPAGMHLYSPGSHEVRCDCHPDGGGAWGGWGQHPYLLFRQFDWLFWTQREFTDEAVFLDHWTATLWRVRRTFPGAPYDPACQFVGYYVSPDPTVAP